MANSIKFSVFLLVAGLVAFASCEKPTPAPDPEPTVFADPANCFMVSEPGFYAFKANKGKTTEAVASIASVEVLWESFGTNEAPSKGNIIPQAYYKDGMVYFKTPVTLKDGNAVIAAQDANHNIVWSWHIWVCNGYDPVATAQTYYNKGTMKFGAVMDRNLGATSAAIDDLKSHGLLYQWGRKDPFLGWNGVEVGEGVPPARAASTLDWPKQVMSDATTGTIEYATAHPTTIIFSGNHSNNGDWYYSSVAHATDNTRWNEKKDYYDPCPAGWTLPQAHTADDQGLWFNALGDPYGWVVIENWDKTHNGYNFTGIFGDAATIWYPYTCDYAKEEGYLHQPDKAIKIWSSDIFHTESDPDGAAVFNTNINMQKHFAIWAAGHGARSCGLPTRCVAVK